MPGSAEGVDPFARDVVARLVLNEVVQRVPVVQNLAAVGIR